MKGQEQAALILLGELLAGVEEDVEDCYVGAEKHVRIKGFLHDLRRDVLVPGLFVRSTVGVRPAVEATS